MPSKAQDQHWKCSVPFKGQPWSRQPGETEHLWAAFETYKRMQPPRLLPELAKILGRSVITTRNYSHRGKWAERVAAWDAKCDAAREEETIKAHRKDEATRAEAMLKEREDIRKQHLQIAKTMLGVVGVELARLARRVARVQREEVETGKESDEQLVAHRDLVQMMREAAKLQRLVLGDATERVAQLTDEWDVTTLSLEEAQQFRDLLVKLNGET